MKGKSQVKSSRGLDLFTNQDVDELTKALEKVNQVTEISWEFVKSVGLVVNGLDTEVEGEEITFGHPRSARAYLDAYLIGYDHGFRDGRTPEEK